MHDGVEKVSGIIGDPLSHNGREVGPEHITLIREFISMKCL